MNSEPRTAIWIGIAGIAMQIITGILVVNVAIEVIQTRLKYNEDEILRLRQWREQTVDPTLRDHTTQLDVIRSGSQRPR